MYPFKTGETAMSPLTEKYFARPLLAATVAAALLFNGCQWPTGQPDPSATEILRVEIEPNPVAVGDTTVFTCVVEDSLNPNLRYEWNLDEGPIPFPTTDTNQYRWKVSSDTGSYSHSVSVYPPEDSAANPVEKHFEVVVTEND
jgi:hypothetical protein